MPLPVKIVTDSTADLPEEFALTNDISIVPLYVNFPNKTYRDGIDIKPHDFYPMLKECKELLPKTSTPTIEDFKQLYESLLAKGHQILSIHISSGLSSTVNMAESAAKLVGDTIHVFDSKSISLGIGLQITEAIDLLKSNLPLEKILIQLQEIRERTEVCFSLDTLEYLEKGGRIGKVSALLGHILKIKPVIRVENGIYVPFDKVRNQTQAINSMVSHMLKTLGGKKPRYIAVAHGAAEDAALKLKEAIEQATGMKVSYLQEVGPVIGVHTGPGTLGLAFTY